MSNQRKSGKPPPSNLAKQQAMALLNSWGMKPTSRLIECWSEYLWSMAQVYDEFLLESEQEIEDEANQLTKEPTIAIREELLQLIFESSTILFASLNEAKLIHPRFIANYLNFPKNGIDGGLLTDLLNPIEEFHNIPLMQVLEMLAREAKIQAQAHSGAGSARRWRSYIFGHPAQRLISRCIIKLEIVGVDDPLGKLRDFAECVHRVTVPNSNDSLDWDDYGNGIVKWWTEEGRKALLPILPLSDSDNGTDLEDKSNRLEAVINKIIEDKTNNDLGKYGGLTPDPRLLRKKKAGTG